MAQMSRLEQEDQRKALKDETGFYVSPELLAALEDQEKLRPKKTDGGTVSRISKESRKRGQEAARRKS